jgi:recombination protein RecA
MNTRKKAILVGMILGDAYLQKTGKQNARIRLEHSDKQKDYLLWKGNQFPEFFQGEPKLIVRFNPVYKKAYSYYRWQSNASPEIGKIRQKFYQNGKKIIPQELSELLKSPLSLAVWFMDDGYFYKRDKIAYLYIPKYSQGELQRLLEALKSNFSLEARIKIKRRGNLVLVFSVEETKKLISLIKPFIIPSMQYKLSSLDPLSTLA